MLAGRDTIAAAAADFAPADRIFVAGTAGDQIDDRRGRLARIGVGDPAGLGHRASAKAIAATRAGIGDFGAAGAEQVEVLVRVFAVIHSCSLRLPPEYIVYQGNTAVRSARFA